MLNEHPLTRTEAEEERIGVEIAEMLYLKPITARTADNTNEIGRYRTAYGTKTALGLYRTLKAIMNEGRD